MEPAAAIECIKAFKPKVVYPYHYDQDWVTRVNRGEPRGTATTRGLQELKDALTPAGIEVRLAEWYPASPGATAEIDAAWADYVRRINAADFDGALRYYADDPRFSWVEDGKVRYTTRAQVAQAFAQLKQMGTAKFEYGPLTITPGSSDAATLSTSYKTTIGSAGKEFSFGGTMTIDLVRTNDGWQFLTGNTTTSRQR
jgi:ketosteroid isomerase-like protein